MSFLKWIWGLFGVLPLDPRTIAIERVALGSDWLKQLKSAVSARSYHANRFNNSISSACRSEEEFIQNSASVELWRVHVTNVEFLRVILLVGKAQLEATQRLTEIYKPLPDLQANALKVWGDPANQKPCWEFRPNVEELVAEVADLTDTCIGGSSLILLEQFFEECPMPLQQAKYLLSLYTVTNDEFLEHIAAPRICAGSIDAADTRKRPDRVLGKATKHDEIKEEPVAESSKRVEKYVPTCFISYSCDSEKHEEWVLRLASDLQARMGIRVIFDKWTLRAGGNLTNFMETAITQSDFTILVCTPTYAVKSNAVSGGVGYEKNIVSAMQFNGQKSERFIPLLRGDRDASLPIYLSHKRYLDFTDDSRYECMLEELARELHRKPKITPPPIGVPPF